MACPLKLLPRLLFPILRSVHQQCANPVAPIDTWAALGCATADKLI